MNSSSNGIIGNRLATSVLTAALLCGVQAFAADSNYEVPQTLSASDLVAGDLLVGPHFRVADAVPSNGFLAHYSIQSDFG